MTSKYMECEVVATGSHLANVLNTMNHMGVDLIGVIGETLEKSLESSHAVGPTRWRRKNKRRADVFFPAVKTPSWGDTERKHLE